MQTPQALIRELRAQGIQDPRILAAFEKVPRERFVSLFQRTQAYDNRALPIDCRQTISQPYIVGLMSQALLINMRGQKVLEIGTGSGYQAAILATLFEAVWTIERIQPLQEKAQKLLTTLGFKNIHYKIDDGAKGWPQEAPFAGIMVTAATEKCPHALLEQLDPNGGVMVIPLGDPNKVQILTLIRRQGDDYEYNRLEKVCFVPLVTNHLGK